MENKTDYAACLNNAVNFHTATYIYIYIYNEFSGVVLYIAFSYMNASV
jgi:hypothetical protein